MSSTNEELVAVDIGGMGEKVVRQAAKVVPRQITGRVEELVKGGAKVSDYMVVGTGERITLDFAALRPGCLYHVVEVTEYAAILERVVWQGEVKQVEPVWLAGGVYLNPGDRIAERGDTRLRLTRIEWTALDCMIPYGGRLVRNEVLSHHIWGDDTDRRNGLRVVMSRLRDVLGFDAIETERGQGYRLCLDAPTAATGTQQRAQLANPTGTATTEDMVYSWGPDGGVTA